MNELKDFSINRTKCELYKIRHKSGMYWADITLDYTESTGRIQIASDYGDWQNYWGACGCGFKEFLTRLDIFYTAGKFGCSNWFDINKTIEVLTEAINERFEQEDIDADKRDSLLAEVEKLSGCGQHEYWSLMSYDLEELGSFFEPCEIPNETGITPQFRQFWNEAWAVFIEQLKSEI